MPDIAPWMPSWLPSWSIVALVAGAIFYIVLRIARRAVTASLRLAIIVGTLVVIAIAVLVLNNLLRSAGLPFP